MTSNTYRIHVEAAPGTAPVVPETAAIRLLALLPTSWQTEVTVPNDGFTLDVTGHGLEPAELYREVEMALRDNALTGWQWVNPPPVNCP